MMKCNDLHNKFIFYLESDLPIEEMNQIQLHLDECKECSLFLDDMKKTFETLDKDKIQQSDPFFYTRVKARMEKQAENENGLTGQSVLTKILQPALFTILLLAGVYGGYKIGGTEANYKSAGIETQEVVPYLNEMKSEAIETFLME